MSRLPFLNALLLASALAGLRLTAPIAGLPLIQHDSSVPTPQTWSKVDRAAAALAEVRVDYLDGLATLTADVTSYAAFAKTLSTRATSSVSAIAGDEAAGSAAMAELRRRHAKARLTFKSIEWLLAHRDEAAVRRAINGAPLPSVEPKVATIQVLEPAGFQPIEELVYEPTLDSASATTLTTLTEDLRVAVERAAAFQRAEPLTHAHIWGAARYALVRVFSMGVTGFDTPSSGAALPESAAALAGVEAGLRPYFALLTPTLRDSLLAQFELGQFFLTGGGVGAFDDFDRVGFYRKVISPLYRDLYRAQRQLGIETPAEAGGRPAEHNYAATDIFADDFLNDFVFAGQPAVDPLFSRKRDLGERLFYDVNLSASRKLSCASCHNPERAFTDGEPKSLGSDGQPIARNAPTLIGAVFAERYFADLREPELARQIRHVIQDEHEFATDYLTLIGALGEDTSYRLAFDSAYADVDAKFRLSAYSLGDALASFVRTLHSNSSPVDRYLRGETDVLAADVRRGMNLFMGKAVCATCHFAPTWSGLVPPYYRDSETEVLGVPTVWPLPDSGSAFAKTRYLDPDLGRIASGRPIDNAPFYAFSFKTPTVRNAARTAPYMHNGAFASLGEVVEFYRLGGGVGLGMELPHQTLPFDSLALSAAEVADLVAFLGALTDQAKP